MKPARCSPTPCAPTAGPPRAEAAGRLLRYARRGIHPMRRWQARVTVTYEEP